MKDQWRDDLVCFVTSLSYDFGDRIGKLYMPQANCCDMNKCVTLFKRIDPNSTSSIRRCLGRKSGNPSAIFDIIPAMTFPSRD